MTEIQQAFHTYNARYFRGSLPDCKIVWADLDYFGDYNISFKAKYPTHRRAQQAVRSGEVYAPGNVVHTIRLGKWTRKQRRQWALTLLHEMVHLKLFKDKGRHHGHKFQREMKRLANMGAFNGLW